MKRIVYFFLDGSLGSRSQLEFNSHLIGCPDCEQRLCFQRQLRAFVRRRLAPLNAPERLKVRLTRTIRVFEAAD
ncbi:MAG TPA: zf-HC2 domain-containing protein [Thermoanaerobaculia bacterium]|nr:zf-HC2 domain-containing protein [Thermoanaerobaculia bacterium]